MMALLSELNTTQWATLIAAAFLVGFSKTGIGGLLMIVVPLLAAAFGGKASTGILLPLLVIGDFFAVLYYHRHGDWHGISRLLPSTFVGLFVGIAVGNAIDDRLFLLLIGASVLFCLAILVVFELRGNNLQPPDGWGFYALIGLLAGFCTMIGNVAGPIVSVYLLSRRYNKQRFLGTSAWFFFVVNLSKLPLQIFFWKNMGLATLAYSGAMLPVILVGAIIGVWVVRRVAERLFRRIVIVMTFFAVVRLFF